MSEPSVINIEYQEALRINSGEVYESFIARYPQSGLVKGARERAAYKKAERINTAESYQEFLNVYPKSLMATAARERYMESLVKRGPGSPFVIESIRVNDGYVRDVIFRKNSISGDFLALSGGSAALSAGDGSLFIFDGDFSIESDRLSIGGMKAYILAGLKGLTFSSNPSDPLTFFLFRKRNLLVYKSGKGQIIFPNGKIVTLP